MSATTPTPFGSWSSSITSDLITAESISLVDVLLDGNEIYWIEGRPLEGGRYVIVRHSDHGADVDIIPKPYSARTTVHEYGGGAAVVSNGIVYFSHFSDQRLYRLESQGTLIPLTPSDNAGARMRYADGVIDAQRKRWIGIRETHVDSKEAVNEIVAVSIDPQPQGLRTNKGRQADKGFARISVSEPMPANSGEAGRVLVEGADFYSSPRLSPDGTKLAWLTWNHPNMPWVASELWIGDFNGDEIVNRVRIAGGPTESVFQPEWSADGRLYFISDRNFDAHHNAFSKSTRWWNIYRQEANGDVVNVCPRNAEFGQPQWNFGMSTYAFLSNSEVVCSYVESGEGKLALLDLRTGALREFRLPFTEYSSIRTQGGKVVFKAGAPTIPSSIVTLDPRTDRYTTLQKATTVDESSEISRYFTEPVRVEFPTTHGNTAYGLYYPPKNPDYTAPTNQRPPLVVRCHGGPTAAASSALDLRTQFWTSRGIAVIDVDYGGSTGYGREFRDRLYLQWGIVDAEDCAAAVRFCSDRGWIDATQAVITGGSAGGFTTLTCLTYGDESIRKMFQAGGSHYGVSDPASLARDTHKFESRYLDWLIGPFDHSAPPEADPPQVYIDRAPVHNAGRLSAPVTFFQGTEDKIVPPNQTVAMVRALGEKGLTGQYLLFAGEQHGFRQAVNIKWALDAELNFYKTLVFKSAPTTSPTALFAAPAKGIAAIFFDLGDTLGTATVEGTPPHLTGFTLYPYTLDVLEDLSARVPKLGVISNTGNDSGEKVNAVLRPTGLLQKLDSQLLVYSFDEGVTKSSPEIFFHAARRAGLEATPERLLFVGEDAHERQVADSANWRVCPHPLLVGEVLDGQSLRYVRLTVPADHVTAPWRAELRNRAFVPMRISGPGGTTIIGLTSQRVALELANMQFGIEFLGEPDLPKTADLYLLRDDLAKKSGFLASDGEAARVFAAAKAEHLIIATTPEGVVAAFTPDMVRSLDTFHFEGARHGHNQKLTPDALLWETASTGKQVSTLLPAHPTISTTAAAEFATITPDEIQDIVDRYSGKTPLDGVSAARVRSRHIRHADNTRAVAQAAADLLAAGGGLLQVQLHHFSHGGVGLANVEAELAGATAELVLVTAHLDSTAAANEPYAPASDPAPGADDDASGMAAVLAIARRFVNLARAGTLARTVRFVLFNAEEQGLVGSQAYAHRSKARGETITAVWQMDMIGYNKLAPATWEVHAGFETSPAVEAQSRRLADLIKAIAGQVSPSLPPAQIYDSQTLPEGDPAAGRSDHASFQAQGYPAVVVSEDFFVGPGSDAPAPEENPNYHQAGDTFIDPEYAAQITRALGVAAWVSASQSPTTMTIPTTLQRTVPTFTLTHKEHSMTGPREFDSRKLSPQQSLTAATKPVAAVVPHGVANTNSLTGTPSILSAAVSTAANTSVVEQALTFARSQSSVLGFTPGSPVEFVPDPIFYQTSSGATTVNLAQTYRGLQVFQMSRSVRFDPRGQVVDAVGDTAPIPAGLDVEPKLSVEQAVLAAARHLATTGIGETVPDEFGNNTPLPAVDLKDFNPTVVAGFPLPSHATVLEKGPFENAIPAHLLIFNQPTTARLAWYVILTLPGYTNQYAVIVAADHVDSEILYCISTMRVATARGRVFEFNPGVADRRMIDFPRPLTEYPVMPTTPISGFPTDWVDVDKTFGNSTRATLNLTPNTLTGSPQSGVVVFDPMNRTGDDQKLLNIFYFCNYMHDFLYILGFDEAFGNFQQVNFTHTGSAGDPVRARAHSGAVNGTANMSTAADGLPPLMNMGLVVSSGNHTALDADVVFHEYTHGLTNRLVGGRLNGHSLEKLQSGMMGEGWSDYYALTIQNYFRAQEKTVTGDWVIGSPGGIRRAPYDDNFPFKYGSLSSSPEVHDGGEVWCATLMMMTRKIRIALGNDQQGYRLAWQMVTDGLKLTGPNPTFLDARDAILRALDYLGTTNRIPQAIHVLANRAAWEAFAHFEMGVNASSGDADDVDSITPDTTLPTTL